MTDEVTLLVSSCDAFSDCWRPFAHGLRKYWPDLPFRAVLITNELRFEESPVTSLPVGPDRGWAMNLLTALSATASGYVMYMQEDYWLTARVNTQRTQRYVDLLRDREDLHYLRLLASPHPDGEPLEGGAVAAISPGAPYRTGLQAALWRARTLRDLLEPGESAWQFEILGSRRSCKYETGFLSVTSEHGDEYARGIHYLCSAINRGRWSRAALAWARAEGVDVDFSRRPVENWWHEYSRREGLGCAVRIAVHRAKLILADPRQAARKVLQRWKPRSPSEPPRHV